MINPSLADGLAAASLAMPGYRDEARMLIRRVREANPALDVDRWLSPVSSKERWYRALYREGLKRRGFEQRRMPYLQTRFRRTLRDIRGYDAPNFCYACGTAPVHRSAE
jgi:hypothetical protein